VAFLDSDGTILLTNRPEVLAGQPGAVRMDELGDVFEIFHPGGERYAVEEWPALRSVRTGEVIVDEEFFRLAPDGSRREFSTSSAPVYDADGKVAGAVLLTREVTERRRSEEQLAHQALGRAQAENHLSTAREAERRRVARELHDDGLRELTEALGAAAIGRSRAGDEADQQQWALMTVSLQRLGQHLRSAIYDLRLGTHEERAFADLLQELVAVQDGLTVEVPVSLHDPQRLPGGSLGHPGSESLRIVREAITNARRHSGTAEIRVDAGRSTGSILRIDVSDDGAWPDRHATVASGRGSGLLGMRERADEIGAKLRIEGRADGGTTVSLALPLAGLE
jgi:PAS domain S-box-containing protein